MQKMTIRAKLIIVLSVLFLLTACGQKGDLYLPESSSFIAWVI